MKAQRSQRLLGGILGVLFVLGLVLSSFKGGPEGVDKSVTAVHPKGRRAAFDVLNKLGLTHTAWREAPVFLPKGEHLLWMPKIPVILGNTSFDEELDEEDDFEPGGLLDADPRNPLHYGEFVRAGGTLLLPYNPSNFRWLRDDCGLEVPDWLPLTRQATLDLEIDTGESLHVSLGTGFPVEAPGSGEGWDDPELEFGDWHDLAWGRAGQPFASWTPAGYGRVVFLASDAFLDNENLGAFDNGLLLTRIVEALRPAGKSYFDEYALGLWVPPTQLELMMAPGFVEVGLHALLGLLLFVLVHAWVREFPRDPTRPALDPRLRVTSQAALFERAERFDLLALDLQAGVAQRVCRRFGLRRADHGPDARAGLAQLVETLAERSPAGLDLAEWRRLFHPTPVTDRNALEHLGRELRAFEESARPRSSVRSPLRTS